MRNRAQLKKYGRLYLLELNIFRFHLGFSSVEPTKAFTPFSDPS